MSKTKISKEKMIYKTISQMPTALKIDKSSFKMLVVPLN
jgi:hypothetical protein